MSCLPSRRERNIGHLNPRALPLDRRTGAIDTDIPLSLRLLPLLLQERLHDMLPIQAQLTPILELLGIRDIEEAQLLRLLSLFGRLMADR